MSDISAHHLDLQGHVNASSLFYRIIFTVLFTFSLATFAVARLFGRSSNFGLITQARQAAHASAGYAVQH